MSELKPCPFCESTEIYTQPMTTTWWIATCAKCTATIEADSEEEAIAAWNKRPETYNDSLKKGSGVFYCGKCHCHVDIALMDSDDFYEPKHCPECGKKVNDDKIKAMSVLRLE